MIHPEQGGRLKYTLNIIDTPGFGDTSGLDRDSLIVDQVRQLFLHIKSNVGRVRENYKFITIDNKYFIRYMPVHVHLINNVVIIVLLLFCLIFAYEYICYIKKRNLLFL